jgi:hypothetical protein
MERGSYETNMGISNTLWRSEWHVPSVRFRTDGQESVLFPVEKEAFNIFQLIQNSKLFYVTLQQATALYRVLILFGERGGVVSWGTTCLHYKPEGGGFDSWWCHWSFILTLFFCPQYGPVVDSSCNRDEYQGYLLGVKAANRADNLITFMCQLSWNLGAPTS